MPENIPALKVKQLIRLLESRGCSFYREGKGDHKLYVRYVEGRKRVAEIDTLTNWEGKHRKNYDTDEMSPLHNSVSHPARKTSNFPQINRALSLFILTNRHTNSVRSKLQNMLKGQEVEA